MNYTKLKDYLTENVLESVFNEPNKATIEVFFNKEAQSIVIRMCKDCKYDIRRPLTRIAHDFIYGDDRFRIELFFDNYTIDFAEVRDLFNDMQDRILMYFEDDEYEL